MGGRQRLTASDDDAQSDARETAAVTEPQVLAALITGAALASYLNYRYLRLPATIGPMVIALALSTVLIILTKFAGIPAEGALAFVYSIDFGHVLLHIMLPFLLFAGALHIDLPRQRERWRRSWRRNRY